MSGGGVPIGEDDLHAWVDGRLPPPRAVQVEEWLSAHPAEAARIAAYRRQRDELRAWLAPKAGEAVPLRLRVSGLAVAQRGRLRRRLSGVAAALALFVSGAGAGWLAGRQPAPSAMTASQAVLAQQIKADALLAHVTYVAENRHAVEVPAREEEHLITWLSNRLGRKLVVPDLAPHGFRLMGGRLLPGENAPAAQFMYVDAEGTRLTLYVRAEPGEGPVGFELLERAGVSGFRWLDHGFGYAVLAEAGRERLLAVAEAVSRQLPLATPPRGAPL